MLLTSRDAQPEDLPAAFILVKERLGIPVADRKDLLRMWGRALEEACCVAPLVMDVDRREGERIVAFGLMFSVPEALIGHARRQAPPYPWRWMLELWRRGQPVWLGKKETRKAELKDGVCLFANNYGVDMRRYSGAELVTITETLSMGAIQGMLRHRLHYFVEEVYGPAERDRHLGFGLDLWRDFGGAEAVGVTEERQPFLMGGDFPSIAKEMTRTNTPVSRMALLGPPKFGFSEAEQEVMKLALVGLTDQAIAERIGLSLVAIKKRWESICEKVNERAFLRSAGEAVEEGEIVRVGRRQVLQMMAEHPEEFWPSPPKKRSNK
jgi:DNA-binding CsgD family transcriptional regulator